MQGVAEQECRHGADAAVARYEAEFDEGMTPDETSLDEEHAR